MLQLRHGIRVPFHRNPDLSTPEYLRPPAPSRVRLDETWRTAAQLVDESQLVDEQPSCDQAVAPNLSSAA